MYPELPIENSEPDYNIDSDAIFLVAGGTQMKA